MIRTLLLLAVLLAACSRGPAEPAERRVNLVLVDATTLYTAPDAVLPAPLRVQAVDAVTRRAVRDVTVEWKVVQGAGVLTPHGSSTDDDGMATASFRTGGEGVSRIEIRSSRMTGPAPVLEIRAVPPPLITAVEPAVVQAGGEAIVRGSGFSQTAGLNVVHIDGVRASILSASTTELRVRVPQCMPARTADLSASIGYARSPLWPIGVTGGQGTVIQLVPGESRTLAEPADFECIRIEGAARALYLIAAQNIATAHAPPFIFELRGLDATPAGITAAPLPAAADFAADWEAMLRSREAQLLRDAGGDDEHLFIAPRLQRDVATGDRRDFNIITPTNTFQKITASVRHISDRAILYVDEDAPAGGFSDADLRFLGELFDGPIWSASIAVFGEPSDLDGNQRVVIVLTPRVNALTPRGQSSFAAGYFYGCDLLSRSRCPGSNGGEIFYSMVPDPDAKWGDRRTTAAVLATVPPVLAHEFQHMIHFARRGFSADVLWLAEALAHTNEEVVADAITDANLAAAFRAPNYHRAQRYLTDPSRSSLIALEPPGSIEMRGAGWLLLKHLRGHHGGHDLLQRLTATSLTGVDNVTAATGRSWAAMLHDFNIALWADNAPELDGTLPAAQQFVGFDLRATLGSLPGGYTLRPTTVAWRDFTVAGLLPAASPRHFLLSAPLDGAAPVHMVFSGPFGEPFSHDADAALTILRVR